MLPISFHTRSSAAPTSLEPVTYRVIAASSILGMLASANIMPLTITTFFLTVQQNNGIALKPFYLTKISSSRSKTSKLILFFIIRASNTKLVRLNSCSSNMRVFKLQNFLSKSYRMTHTSDSVFIQVLSLKTIMY